MLVLVPPLLFAVAALWFGARQIVRPLQQLELLPQAQMRGAEQIARALDRAHA